MPCCRTRFPGHLLLIVTTFLWSVFVFSGLSRDALARRGRLHNERANGGSRVEAGKASLNKKALIVTMTMAQLSAMFEGLHASPLPVRIERWGRLFLEAPYSVDPLGEGPSGRYDKDPLMDFSRVDCMSFIEQVIALSFSNDLRETLSWLLRIRYRNGKPSFRNRHYTMVKGWIEANVRLGILTDITRSVGGSQVRVASVNLADRKKWNRRHKRRFKMMGRFAPRGVAKVDYIPLENALSLGLKIPNTTLIHIISEHNRATPYLVTHVGFMIHKNRAGFFRHASRTPSRRRVEDRPLRTYLKMLKQYYGRRGKRKVLGIHLTRINPPKNG